MGPVFFAGRSVSIQLDISLVNKLRLKPVEMVPSLKLTSHLKMDGWKTMAYFQGRWLLVSGRVNDESCPFVRMLGSPLAIGIPFWACRNVMSSWCPPFAG